MQSAKLEIAGGCLLVLLLASASPADDPRQAFFEKKIRPVLVEHCYKCHAVETKKQRGGLAVDSRDALLKGGESGPVLVAGKPAESLLMKALHYSDDGLKMPPKGKLPDAVIADFDKWIAEGAFDPRTGNATIASKPVVTVEEGRKFWAFRPVQESKPPAVKNQAWPRDGIDRFILAALEEKGLSPAADADRAVLLRRVYFDLIGLPPTPEEIEAFLSDKSPEAFAKVVDRLLASPHFGERWGRHWLDVARFAESSGGGRSLLFPDAWRYRDYVIRSLNEDKPYRKFIVEQLAGDLLDAGNPDERAQQIIATAFLALGPTNYERQDKQILEMDVIDEQLDTVGRAFLGLTIGCARCHDHKFDPIPTKDYYALAGIFRSTRTLIHNNVSTWVEQPLPVEPARAAEFAKHDAAIAALEARIKEAKAKLKGTTVATPAAPTSGPVAVKDLPGLVLDDVKAKRIGQWTASRYNNSFVGEGYLHDGNSEKGQKTLTFVPEFKKDGLYEVRLAYTAASNRAPKVPVTVLSLEGEQTIHVNQQKNPPIDGRWISLGKFRFDTNGQWFVLISNEGTTGHVIVDAVQFLSEEDLKKENAADTAKVSPPKKEKPAPKGTVSDADIKKMEAELKKLQAAAPKRPTAMAVNEAPKIDDCFVCIRGNFHNRGDVVPRGFLQVATPPGSPTGNVPKDHSGRLELARWIASDSNPLTARVYVNRVWHHLFGAGIVRSVDNFGFAGERPSHPQLLDHLCGQFMAEGWSTKQLIRRIVLSRTYQLASGGAVSNADPENRLLAYMNRRRLDAEAIRDTMLAVSGQLERNVGGPTIRKGTSSEYGYNFDDNRRSVYTPIFRNRLNELFEVFDFPDPNLVGGRRNVSTVPTQALFLLNNPFVMEQAKATAQNLLAKKELSDDQRVERLFQLALGRAPSPKEKTLAQATLAKGDDKAALENWTRLCQAVLACIDFRYVN
ncbi:MAG: DUF1553 domain-containing protein [Gemmataceae bacterium]